VGLDNGLGQVGRLELVTTAILHVNDLDVGMFFLHPVEETITPVNTGAAGLVVHDQGNFATVAYQLGHFVGSIAGSRNVVGSSGRNRNVAVYAGVKSDDRNVLCLCLLQQRDSRFGVERGET